MPVESLINPEESYANFMYQHLEFPRGDIGYSFLENFEDSVGPAHSLQLARKDLFDEHCPYFGYLPGTFDDPWSLSAQADAKRRLFEGWLTRRCKQVRDKINKT
jgi:hypothetical protein